MLTITLVIMGKHLRYVSKLLSKHGPMLYISEMASSIRYAIGDLSRAREICREYLEKFPEDILVQLILARINFRTDNFEELDKFLDSNPEIEELSLINRRIIIDLYKIRNKWNRCFEILYETRRDFYDEMSVHSLYFNSYMEGSKRENYNPDREKVENGCGVLLKDEEGKKSWYIYENREDVKNELREIGKTQKLYRALTNKKIGDYIKFGEGILSKKLRIIAIVDKYFAAEKISFDLLEERPDFPAFRSLKIPKIDGEFDLENIKSFFNERETEFNQIMSNYNTGKFTFGTVANIRNQNPVELWVNLVEGKEPYVHCWSNPDEKFNEAVNLLRKGGLVVIDILSLLTIYHLGIADQAVQVVGKFGIALSTLELLKSLVEERRSHELEGEKRLGSVEGQLVIHELSPEQVIQIRVYFEKIVEWVQNNCCILPCRKALEINANQREESNYVLGLSFTDTILLAGESGRILYTDDQMLRRLGNIFRQEPKVEGVWTQVLLAYCLERNNINKVQYCNAIIKLVEWGYSYTQIDEDILLECVRQANWKVTGKYNTILKCVEAQRLTNKHFHLIASEDYAVKVTVEFIYKLYQEKILTSCWEQLIFKLLRAITINRSQQSIIIGKLILSIERKFFWLPFQAKDIIDLIKVWYNTQTIVS